MDTSFRNFSCFLLTVLSKCYQIPCVKNKDKQQGKTADVPCSFSVTLGRDAVGYGVAACPLNHRTWLDACSQPVGGTRLRALSEAFMKIEPNLLSYLLQLVCFLHGYGVHAQAGSTAGGNSLMHSNLCLASKNFSRPLIQMDKTSSSRIIFYSSP